MRRVDILVGVVWIVLGTLTLTQSIPLGFFASGGRPDSGFFPSLIGISFVLLGALLVVHRATSPADAFGDYKVTPWPRLARALAVWGSLMITIWLLPILGFIPATVLLTATLLLVVERLRNVAALITIPLLPLAFWALFDRLLGVPLPQGLF